MLTRIPRTGWCAVRAAARILNCSFPSRSGAAAVQQINYAKAVCGRCPVAGKLSFVRAADHAGRYLGRDDQRRAHRDARPVGRAFPGSGRRVRSGRSWPGRQWWILNRIENRLRADDHRLSSLFAVFARLTRAEAMPAAERIEGGPWRLLSKTRSHRRERRRLRAAVPGKLPGPTRRPFLFIILMSFPRSGPARKILLARGRAVPALLVEDLPPGRCPEWRGRRKICRELGTS